MKRLILVTLVILFAAVTEGLPAETFPTKPITLLVGFSPGGSADILSRAMAAGASKHLGQSVVVLNKPGAAGTIAIDYVAQSRPDGYTLIAIGLQNLALGIHTQGLRWGPDDFSLLLGTCGYNFALVVRPDAPWKNFDEWVQYVRQNPGFKYSTPGASMPTHLIMEWIAKRLDLKLTPIHLKGDADGIVSVMGGHIQLHSGSGVQASHVKAGKLRTLLQLVGDPADANPSSIPTLKKLFPDAPIDMLELSFTVFGPRGISPPVQTKLHDAFKKGSVENPDFIKATQTLFLHAEYQDSKELHAKLLKSLKFVGDLLRELKLDKKPS